MGTLLSSLRFRGVPVHASRVRAGPALATFFLLSGCAFTPERIQIGYPAPADVARVAGAEAIRVRVEVKDLRAERTFVVAHKVAYGIRTARLYSAEPVEVLMARSVATELRARGYVVADDGAVPLEVDLVLFSHEFRPGPLAVDSDATTRSTVESDATVMFTATVRDAGGAQLYRDTFTGPFHGSVQIAGASNAREAYERALPIAVRKLAASERLQDALAAAASRR